MAHDGFVGTFHGLAWPYAHGATPFDALQVQHALMGAGWEHEPGALALDSPALSSLVSSPAAAAATGGRSQGAVLMDELVSRLGVCGGLAIPSPPSSSQHASCYSTPVGSPSKPAPPAPPRLAADAAALAERAARLPCLPAAGGPCGRKLSRVASSQSLFAGPAPGGAHLPARDGSSSGDGHCRKRKAPGAKAKGKDAVTTAITKSPEPETRAKKCKLSADATREEELIMPGSGDAAGHGGSGNGKEAAEDPHKDYIHVRARRGQATDSHSLAERVRREKISERMKLLQDLVPSCNKVTGKAVMLDEIINYVQSLQRQVEFLSMKLATVNPRLEFDVDNFLPKDANEPSVAAPPSSLSLPPPAYSLEGSSPAFCYASPPGTAMQSVVVTNAKGFDVPPSFANHGIPGSSSLEAFQNGNPQIGSLWEDDLQSVVQMGFRGNT